MKYTLHFFCEWGAGCLWPRNDAAYEAFGFGPCDVKDPCLLSLSAETLKRCRDLDMWHRTSLNPYWAPEVPMWRQEECDRFNAALIKLVADIRSELGTDFEVLAKQKMQEDPDLEAYLADPKGFRPKPLEERQAEPMTPAD